MIYIYGIFTNSNIPEFVWISDRLPNIEYGEIFVFSTHNNKSDAEREFGRLNTKYYNIQPTLNVKHGPSPKYDGASIMADKRTLSEIAIEHNVCTSSVLRIKRGKTYQTFAYYLLSTHLTIYDIFSIYIEEGTYAYFNAHYKCSAKVVRSIKNGTNHTSVTRNIMQNPGYIIKNKLTNDEVNYIMDSNKSIKQLSEMFSITCRTVTNIQCNVTRSYPLSNY